MTQQKIWPPRVLELEGGRAMMVKIGRRGEEGMWKTMNGHWQRSSKKPRRGWNQSWTRSKEERGKEKGCRSTGTLIRHSTPRHDQHAPEGRQPGRESRWTMQHCRARSLEKTGVQRRKINCVFCTVLLFAGHEPGIFACIMHGLFNLFHGNLCIYMDLTQDCSAFNTPPPDQANSNSFSSTINNK